MTKPFAYNDCITRELLESIEIPVAEEEHWSPLRLWIYRYTVVKTDFNIPHNKAGRAWMIESTKKAIARYSRTPYEIQVGDYDDLDLTFRFVTQEDAMLFPLDLLTSEKPYRRLFELLRQRNT